MVTRRNVNTHVIRQSVRTSKRVKRNRNRVMMRKTKLRYGRWNTQTSCPQTEGIRPPKMNIYEKE